MMLPAPELHRKIFCLIRGPISTHPVGNPITTLESARRDPPKFCNAGRESGD
jgi:hypothetical protein